VKKAVIYTRFSPRPNAKDCESCENQLDFCRKYSEAKGWQIVGNDRDEGYSGGRADNRPGLQRALLLAMRHKAALVVYSLSRLARSLPDTLTIIAKLHKYGADIASVREPIDTTSAMGEAIFQILAVIAELERKQIAERTSDAMLHYQANGRKMSYLPPYGKMDDPENESRLAADENYKPMMIDNPQEQEIITKIIDWHNDGISLRKIVDLLNADGLPARTNKWHHSKVHCIICDHRDLLKPARGVPVKSD
jgi:site-specific DNA recombinase